MDRSSDNVIARLDAVVDDFSRRTRFFHEPLTRARAEMFVRQHRLNTRQRNSVLKLKVATNTPDWDLKLDIIGACAEEIIADHEFFGGKPHWQVLQQLGVRIGMPLADIEAAEPLPTTRVGWFAWEGLMANRHWLEGLIGNTCAERANVPGYGPPGVMREHGWFAMERQRWQKLFGLADEDLVFFSKHEEADLIHSDMGWRTVAERATALHMEDAVVKACYENLLVWEIYLNGIGDGADALERGVSLPTCK
jgi:pyrroloquinoline quinone (PQQ) biosynthesis protein C